MFVNINQDKNMDVSGNSPSDIPKEPVEFVKEADEPPPMAGHGDAPHHQFIKVEQEDTPENLFEALGRCGLFSKETDKIPDIVAFDDNIYNEDYYRKKHGKAFPDEWYKIMADVSKKKFEDMRAMALTMEKINGHFNVSFESKETEPKEITTSE